MTVSDLLEKLRLTNPDATVYVHSEGEDYPNYSAIRVPLVEIESTHYEDKSEVWLLGWK